MRKILIAVLIIILVAGIGLTLVNGITLGKIQISSIRQLAEKDKKLEEDLYSLQQMQKVKFPETIDELNQSAKDLKNKREEYSSFVTDSTESEMDAVVTAQKYEVEYLWVKLGNYATKNGVTLKLNILNPSTGMEGMYNLQFTLNGKYAGITEFIYEIENDSTLGFKIDNFSLTPTVVAKDKDNKDNTKNQTADNQTVDTDTLTATFTVKEVSIDISTQQVTPDSKNETEQESQQTNTTNTTVDNTVQ